MSESKKMLTVAEVAERLGYENRDPVYALIRAAELSAVNVALKQGTRPTWRVSEDALAEFVERRTNRKPDPAPVVRRKKLPPVHEYV
jgi:excisionase family DNA binding protein